MEMIVLMLLRSLLMGLLWIPLYTATLQVGSGQEAAKAEASAPKVEAVRYRIIIRVIRPQWRSLPSEQQMKTNINYYANIGMHTPISGNGSDANFIHDLQQVNPQFSFDHLQAKTTFLLDADTVWTAPTKLCMQKFHFAIVEHKNELLKYEIPTNTGLAYKVDTNNPLWQKIRKEGRLTLSFCTRTSCLGKNNQQLPHYEADVVAMVKPCTATCLNSDLPTQAAWTVGAMKELRLPEYDVVFVTIIPESTKTQVKTSKPAAHQ